MISEESPDSPIRASSATACHHIVLKAINAARLACNVVLFIILYFVILKG